MLSNRQNALIFIKKSGFQLYYPPSQTILSFPFSNEIVLDMDIIDKNKFIQKLSYFIDSNKIPPLNLYIVLSKDVLFIKEFINVNEPQKSEVVGRYLDSVPFEAVAHRMIPINNGVRVYAVNKDLYITIQSVFEQKKSTLLAVVPLPLLGEKFETINELNIELAQKILQESDVMRQQSMYAVTKVNNNEEILETDDSSKANKKRLIFLVIIFCLLLLILATVFLFNRNSQPKNISSQENVSFQAVSKSNPTISPTITSTESAMLNSFLVPASDEFSILSVRINTNLDNQSVAKLRSELNKLGFEKIEVITESRIGTTRNIIIVKPSVSTNIRNILLSEISKIINNITIQENSSATADIVININF